MPDPRPPLAQAMEDFHRRSEETEAGLPPGQSAISRESLEALDCNLASEQTEFLSERPPLAAMLMIPNIKSSQPLTPPARATLHAPRRARDPGVNWRAGFALLLAVLLGATTAAFVFHDRLSQIVAQQQTGVAIVAPRD